MKMKKIACLMAVLSMTVCAIAGGSISVSAEGAGITEAGDTSEYLDPENPAAGICPQKPVCKKNPPDQAVSGAGPGEFFPVSWLRRCDAAIYFLL